MLSTRLLPYVWLGICVLTFFIGVSLIPDDRKGVSSGIPDKGSDLRSRQGYYPGELEGARLTPPVSLPPPPRKLSPQPPFVTQSLISLVNLPHWNIDSEFLKRAWGLYEEELERDRQRLLDMAQGRFAWSGDFAKENYEIAIKMRAGDSGGDDSLSNRLMKRANDVKMGLERNYDFMKPMMEPPSSIDRTPSPVILQIHRQGDFCVGHHSSLKNSFLHLLRDWTDISVAHSTAYEAIVEKLVFHLPVSSAANTRVLVPGAGLGRLGFEIAKRGYDVEMNECSQLFVETSAYIFNDVDTPRPASPLLHLFSQQFHADDTNQFLSVNIPSPLPRKEAAWAGVKVPVDLVVGDFVHIYSTTQRQYGAVVTCFFIDMITDFTDVIRVIDRSLVVGGVWINLGPLSWKQGSTFKFSYDDIQAALTGLGYEFVHVEQKEVVYSLPFDTMMYEEQYRTAFSVAVKRR
eukprot:Rmarinus@m.10226